MTIMPLPDLVALVPSLARALLDSPLFLLYVGPDQFMPLASVLSAIVGVALMFWHKLVGIARRAWALVTGRSSGTAEANEPAE